MENIFRDWNEFASSESSVGVADVTETTYASSKYQGTAVGGWNGNMFFFGFCDMNLDFFSACVGATDLKDFTDWLGKTSGLGGVGSTGPL